MGLKETLTKDISREVIVVIVVLAMCGLWVWAFGGVPIKGQDGFVLRVTLASDVQTIVGKDIDELKRQTTEMSSQTREIKTALDQILADYYAKRVKDGVRQRCKLSPLDTAERDRLWDQINEDLRMYRIYSGDMDWQRPTCGEV